MNTWRANNHDKIRAYNRKHYQYDPVASRAKALRRKFGVTVEQYEALRAHQNDSCAICMTRMPGGKGDWHMDHDHKSKRARGLLCQNCNIGLGNFKDDPEKLNKAARYLRKHQKLAKLY